MKAISSLITEIKTRAFIPDGQMPDATIITFIQAAMDDVVYPEIFAWNEEFFLVSEILSPTNKVLTYPHRAYGRNLREIKEVDDTSRKNLPRIDIEELEDNNYGFYVKSDEIGFLSDLSSVEVTYPVAGPNLSTTDVAASITNISYASGTTTFTLTTSTGFTDYLPTGNSRLVDLYKKVSGSYVKVDLLLSRSGTTYTTASLTLDEVNILKSMQKKGFPISNNIEASLLLLPASINNFSAIPKEADNLLILAAISKYLEAVGDTEGLSVNQMKLTEAKKACQKALSKRITGESKVIGSSKGILNYMNNGNKRRW